MTTWTRRLDKRIDDVRDLLRAEIKASENTVRAQMAELRSLMEKNHSELLVKFAEIDNRLTRLEGERRVIS